MLPQHCPTWGLRAVVVCGLVACADAPNPTQPLGPGRATPAPALDYSASDPAAGTITVVDETNGDQYVLNVPERRIYISGSQNFTILLSPEQMPVFTQVFHGILHADATIADLDSAMSVPEGDGCGYDPRLGYDPCAQASSLTPGPVLALPDEPGQIYATAEGEGEADFLMEFVSSGPSTTYYGVPSGAGAAASYATWDGGSSLGIASYGDMCSDVAGAVIPKKLHFRTHRTSLLRDVVVAAVTEGVNQVRDKIFPPGSAILSVAAVAATEHWHAQLSISVLAYYWNTYNCSQKQVRLGPVFVSGGPGSGGGGHVVFDCREDIWQISFDGGRTWHRVTVTVCEVNYA